MDDRLESQLVTASPAASVKGQARALISSDRALGVGETDAAARRGLDETELRCKSASASCTATWLFQCAISMFQTLTRTP